MLLFLAAVRDRSWRSCFSDGRPTSHEFNKLPLHLSAVLPCSLEDQLCEIFPVKEQNFFFLSIKPILKGGDKTPQPILALKWCQFVSLSVSSGAMCLASCWDGTDKRLLREAFGSRIPGSFQPV